MKKIVFCTAIILILNSIIFIGNTHAMQNPWIDCGDDISCAAKKASFNFPLRVSNYSARAMEDMIEMKFQLDKKRTVTIRKSVKFYNSGDNSGVYKNYPVLKDISLKNGIELSVRGNIRKFYVANFSAESGYYSIYCEKGMKLKDLEYLYSLIAEAEAPRFDGSETKTLEQLMDSRRVDGIVEPVYTQDCFPKTLEKKGVTKECFERANLGEDSICSLSQVKMIKEYYENGYKSDPLNNGEGDFCTK